MSNSDFFSLAWEDDEEDTDPGSSTPADMSMPSGTWCYFHGPPSPAVVRLDSGHPICAVCAEKGVP